MLLRVNGAPKAIPAPTRPSCGSGDAGDLYGFWGMPLEGDAARRREAKGHEMLGDMVGFTKAEGAEKPEGEWNVYEITVDGPSIVALVNGTKVNEANGRPGAAGTNRAAVRGRRDPLPAGRAHADRAVAA